MTFLGVNGPPLIVLGAAGLICLLEMFFLALIHYEFAIAGMIMSPWVHWVFSMNDPEKFQDFHVGPASYLRVCIVLAIGAVGYCNFFRFRSRKRGKLPAIFGLLMAFLAYALFSTVYSIDRFYTLSRSVEYIAFFGFLLGLHYWLRDTTRLNRALNIFFAVMALGIIVNLFSFVLFPGEVWWWRSVNRFKGITDHPNTLGAFCMLCYPIFMWKYNNTSGPGRFCVAAMCCITFIIHLLTGSRTSLAASFFGVTVWHLALNHKTKVVMVALSLFIAGLLIIAAKPGSLTRESNNITDLTGRAGFWIASLPLIKEQPLTGYGYEVGGKVWMDPRFYNPYVALWSGNARAPLHNGYLSTLIGLGVIGFLMWLILVVNPIYQLMKIESNHYKALVTVIIFQALLVNFFESEICGSRTSVSILFWIMWIVTGRLFIIKPKVSFSRSRRGLCP